MIRAIIERKAKGGVNIFPRLREIRIAAVMHFQGYLGGETLVNTEDSSDIIVISSWESLADWKRWVSSKSRTELYEKIEPLLQEKPRVRTFQIVATEDRPAF